MPANTAALQAAIDALVAQATATEGVEASATAVINTFAQEITDAVTAALQADNAADNTSIQAATDAITAVKVRFTASAKPLGDAIAATPAPTPTPTPTV